MKQPLSLSESVERLHLALSECSKTANSVESFNTRETRLAFYDAHLSVKRNCELTWRTACREAGESDTPEDEPANSGYNDYMEATGQ